MKLWTIQKPQVLTTLRSQGVYRADTDMVLKDRLMAPEVKLEDDFTIIAYKWMATQMKKRIGNPHNGVEFPIWAWKQPMPRIGYKGHGEKGKKMVRIELDVDDKDVLLSDFMLWSFPYSSLFLPCNHKEYVDFLRLINLEGFNEYSDKKLPKKLHKIKEKSWEDVFDLNCEKISLTSHKKEKIIQACLWEIRFDQVVSYKRFECR